VRQGAKVTSRRFRWMIAGFIAAAAAHDVAAQVAHERAVQVEHVVLESSVAYDTVKNNLEATMRRFNAAAIRSLVTERKVEEARRELQAASEADGLLYHARPPGLDPGAHGEWLVLSGRPAKISEFFIGNVLSASEMAHHHKAAALYAPLRIVMYERAGRTIIEYDRPSSLFGQYGDERVDRVARSLDSRLERLLVRLTGGDLARVGVARSSREYRHVVVRTPVAFEEVQRRLEGRSKRLPTSLSRLLQQGNAEAARRALEEATQSGLALHTKATHGLWLAFQGSDHRLDQYVLGNILLAVNITNRAPGAGLYAQARLVMYEDESGETVLEYDRPSSQLKHFKDPIVENLGVVLDLHLDRLVQEITRSH